MSSQLFGPAHLPIFDPSPTRGVTKIRASGALIHTMSFQHSGSLPQYSDGYVYSERWTPPADITLVAVDIICGVCPSVLKVRLDDGLYYIMTEDLQNLGTPGTKLSPYRLPYFANEPAVETVGIDQGMTVGMELRSASVGTHIGSDLSVLVHYVMGSGPRYVPEV